MPIERNRPEQPFTQSIDVEIEDDAPVVVGDVTITPTEDGGAILEEVLALIDEAALADHNANLAEFMEEDDLRALSDDLIEAVKADDASREEWTKTTAKGLSLLGLEIEERTEPWEGACGVTHPILAMAAVRFNSRAINELFPSGSPVKSKIVGVKTLEIEKQAQRVSEFFNYMLQHEMEEYFDEHDKLLWVLPTVGCCFKKCYFDPGVGRPVSEYVPAENFIVAYGTKSLKSSGRYTHVIQMSPNDVRRSQLTGFYRDIDLSEPDESSEELNDIQERKDAIQGRENQTRRGDDRHTLYEVHAELDLKGFEDIGPDGNPTGLMLPYIVTIDRDSGRVLAIRRNWMENDPTRRRRCYFVKYGFIPGFGFYDIGYIQILGGIASAATSILRQLVDAGTLANLPAGFKSRGLKVRDNDSPLAPGEWREVDAPGMDLDKALKMLPYKGADPSLVTMLDRLIEWGERLAQTTDMQIDNLNKEVPVGTVMALLEENNDVRSAIMRRLHVAQRNEYRLLSDLFREWLPPEYPFDVSGAPRSVFKADFDGRIDILPVSDPRTYSRSQRMMIAQAKLQMAQQAPQLHDMRAIYREIYDAMGVDDVDRIMPPPPQAMTGDPITENVTLLAGSPVKAAMEQNHEAHIQAHMGFLQMVMMNPATQAVAAQAAQAIQAHVTEHFAMYYQATMAVQAGIPLEMLNQQLPPEIEARVSQAAAEATMKIQQQLQSTMQGVQPPNPAMMLAQTEMQEVERKRTADMLKHAREVAKMQQDAAQVEAEQAIKGAEVLLKYKQQQIDALNEANDRLERIRNAELQQQQQQEAANEDARNGSVEGDS